MKKRDAGGLALGGEAAGLVDQFLGEVKGGEAAVAERPKAEGDTTGAAAGLKQRGVPVAKEAFDQDSLRSPKAELVSGARVVNDGKQVVEIGADLRGGNFFQRR